MTITRLALLLSLATAAAWTAKAIAIAVAGGLGRSPLEGPLFLAGLGLAIVAAAVSGLALVRGSRWFIALGAAAAVVVGVSLLSVLVQVVVTATQPAHPGWVWGELNLWVIPVALVALNLSAVRTRDAAPNPEAASGSTIVAPAASPSR